MLARTVRGTVLFLRICGSLAAMVRLAVDLVVAECSVRFDSLKFVAFFAPFSLFHPSFKTDCTITVTQINLSSPDRQPRKDPPALAANRRPLHP